MANAEQLRNLIESFAEGDDGRFRAVAMEIAASAAKRGQRDLATELRALVDRSREVARGGTVPRAVPITRPSSQVSELLAVTFPKVRFSHMVLSEAILGRLVQILTEYRRVDRLREHGFEPKQKLLLVGPPGCGKTMTARALAGETGLPLLTIQFHTVITRFMGEAAAKLHALFESMHDTRGVYLFDEFDIIGTTRTSANDVGEARRIVNAFLQYVEQDDSDSLVIAATNHVEMIDHAMFRRFDDIIRFESPSPEMIKQLVRNRLSIFYVRLSWDKVLDAATGLSHSEVVKACEDAGKEAVLDDRKSIRTEALVRALRRRAEPGS